MLVLMIFVVIWDLQLWWSMLYAEISVNLSSPLYCMHITHNQEACRVLGAVHARFVVRKVNISFCDHENNVLRIWRDLLDMERFTGYGFQFCDEIPKYRKGKIIL